MKITNKEKNKIHEEASKWRNMKLKEIDKKENPSEIEIYFILRLVEIYGENF